MNNEVNKIMKLIESFGYKVFIVGGYVRDYLLNKKSLDYDLCTDAKTNDLIKILSEFNPKVELGTVSININNISIEITTFRKEISYIKRKPIYLEVDDLEIDLKRRDFTINTICMDSNENIIDLLNGKEDLDNHIIRLIGNKNKKIIEDPLRILRAIRFSIYLSFNIDDDTRYVIEKNKSELLNISYEVKRRELEKIIKLNGLSKIEEYQLEEVLEIDLSNIKYVDNIFLMLYQIDKNNKYLYTKKEKKIINILNKLKNKEITLYDAYIYKAEIINYLNLLDITNINYDDLVIKSRKDINITSKDILNIVKDNKLIEKVYKDLEYKIINRKLNNNYTDIMSYLKNNTYN